MTSNYQQNKKVTDRILERQSLLGKMLWYSGLIFQSGHVEESAGCFDGNDNDGEHFGADDDDVNLWVSSETCAAAEASYLAWRLIHLNSCQVLQVLGKPPINQSIPFISPVIPISLNPFLDALASLQVSPVSQ